MTAQGDRSAAFLAAAGWDGACRTPLAGDASARRYARLTRAGGETAILMDDPAGAAGTRPFLRIARHLHGAGLSAPAILAEDAAAGLLLLEDLGDGLFARLAASDPESEMRLYCGAIDVLLQLHALPAPEGLELASPERLAGMIAPLFDHYATGIPRPRREAAVRALQAALQEHANETGVLVLRDFHAENLLWLPERRGAAAVGILDFQDAVAGHPAYDLVSLLRDARRDVAPRVAAAATARYLAGSGRERSAFAAACAVLGVQRNLRILGIFARLATQEGKRRYLQLMPRVWRHLQDDLRHPALAGLAPLLRDLPAPRIAESPAR